MSLKVDSESRRLVLKGIVAAGGATALAATAGRATAAPETPSPEPAARPGYRETPHVRKYYDKARI
jgi:hypothetical protein